MTDALKIPRATIQHTNQDQLNRYHNISRMKKFLVKSSTVDSLPADENNFETFSNDLVQEKPFERSPRHSTFSRVNLTAANLARLNELHKEAPAKTNPSSNREITITVDSMVTSTNNKTKENDAASNASSTHFTMVNGYGGSRIKQPAKPVCCNDITAVIVTMTILFMIIIFGVIIFAEYPRMMAEIE